MNPKYSFELFLPERFWGILCSNLKWNTAEIGSYALSMYHQEVSRKCFAIRGEKCLKVRTSLVVQWIGICLPMQGTRVQSLVREDPTCHEQLKPMRHNYWACPLQQEVTSVRSLSTESRPHSLQPEKACMQQWRPSAPKIKKWKKKDKAECKKALLCPARVAMAPTERIYPPLVVSRLLWAPWSLVDVELSYHGLELSFISEVN